MSVPNSDLSPDQQAAGNTDLPPPISPHERLKELIAEATALNGAKDYIAAAGVYSDAAKLQTELYGEMNVENADLLYSYGRCLFFVAQKTSTVLGGNAAQAQLSKDSEKQASKRTKAHSVQNAVDSVNGASLASSSEAVVNPDAPISKVEPSGCPSSLTDTKDKPIFSFTGDENYDDTDEDDEEEEEQGEEDDDFETSFELLDLARILYLRKLDSLQNKAQQDVPIKENSTTSVNMSPEIRQLKTRVADIYDLQSEISLEGEKFAAAVTDLRACLVLKEELELPESSLLAECHYKLSLALEVAGQEQERDAQGNPVGDIFVNWDVRNEAVAEQEAAIQCCRLRISKEKMLLEDLSNEKAKSKAQEQIEDVEDMITEMEDRLAELRKPPINVKTETENDFDREMMAGVLGQIMGVTGKSKEQQRAELAQVIASATDLSSVVKKKTKKLNPMTDEMASNASTGSSKRKINDTVDAEEVNFEKRARVDNAEET